ncbi:hypothetical protein CDD83_5809 [Cordyceps sp. RAO-2017]|nr:hypothetical protein CDD83_5809 [Cordyceps sp. RAO-2017]
MYGLQTTGRLEYHIPTEFSDERPAITRTHIEYHVPISHHPVACRIPRPSTQPAIVGNAEDFSPLYLGPDSPTKFNDYLFSDRSIAGLHVVSFTDATVVVLNWLHTAFDAMAKRALIDAWVLMMQGREDEVPTPCSYRADVLGDLGKHVSSPHRLADRQISKLGLVGWAMSNAIDLVLRSQQTYIVCVPAGFLQDMRASALVEIAAASPDEPKPFLSEGDVLVAWLARLTVSHLPRDSNKTVALQNVFCGRKALTDSFLPAGRPYISNCVFFFNVLISAKDLLSKPISYTAQQMRRAIDEQTTLEQVEAYCAMLRNSNPNKFPPFFGDSSMHLISFSNWSKADFFGIDFSAASLSGSSKPLRPSYIQNVQTPYKFTEMYPIIGKDANGNYWVSASRVTKNWAVVEEAFKRHDFMFQGASFCHMQGRPQSTPKEMKLKGQGSCSE